MRRIPTVVLGAVTVLACAAFAAGQAAKSLLPTDAEAVFKLSDSAGGYARMSTTAVTGQAFKSALRIEVAKKPERAQQVTISTPVDAAIANGDVLMISFWMRSGGPGEATLDAAFRTPMPVGARGARGGASGRREGRVRRRQGGRQPRRRPQARHPREPRRPERPVASERRQVAAASSVGSVSVAEAG